MCQHLSTTYIYSSSSLSACFKTLIFIQTLTLPDQATLTILLPLIELMKLQQLGNRRCCMTSKTLTESGREPPPPKQQAKKTGED